MVPVRLSSNAAAVFEHFLSDLKHFMKISESKDVLESQRFWPIMISSPRSEIWANLDCDTCELESAVIFSIQTEHKTRTARFNECAFQKQKGANG